MPKLSRVTLAVVAAVLVAVLVWFGAQYFGGAEALASPAGIEVKDRIELGAVPNGSLVQVPFEVVSRARRAITLTAFHGSCACQTVYELADGAKRSLAEVTLEPGSVRTLYSEIRINGEPGTHNSVVVNFKGDGGAAYQVVITYIPVASLYAVPSTVSFGDILAGQPATQEVEIRSDGSLAVPLGKVTSSHADVLTVSYSPPTKEQREGLPKTDDGQYLVGNLGLTLLPPSAGPWNQEVVISSDGKEVLRLPVSARVVSDYQLSPGELLLPRFQASGAPIYSTKVVCRARDGRPITVEPVTDPALPFDVKPSDREESGPCVFDVRYTGPAVTGCASRDFQLRFKVVTDKSEAVLTLPVKVLALD